MKIIFTLFLILTFSNFSYSQKLNLNDLKYVYEHDIESVDYYLLKKGFEFYNREKEDESLYPSGYKGIIRYSNQYMGKNRSYIIKDGDESNEGLSFYQFYDKSIYISIREECKKIGYKLLSTESVPLDDSSLKYIYTNGKREIEFSSSYSQNTTIYFISFSKYYP